MRGIGLSFSLFPVRIDSSLLILWMGGGRETILFFLSYLSTHNARPSFHTICSCVQRTDLSPSLRIFGCWWSGLSFPSNLSSPVSRSPFVLLSFFSYYFLKCSNKKKRKKSNFGNVVRDSLFLLPTIFFARKNKTKKKK